ncbi:MAG: hypothetical protein FJY65_07140 [Calditrichaeota bacterium]|nr:hypothetical protein [Calditrichota bacterium]
MKSMRQSTLETLGLGTILDIFQSGRQPVREPEMVEVVFGAAGHRGAMVISGGNGIVGSGKAMQIGSRLLPYDVPIVTLDLPNSPDGLRQQYNGLRQSFGEKRAADIMANIVQMSYDGANLPAALNRFNPRFVLEAIPEILSLKRAHYDILRKAFPNIEIRSVTSGFPASELGVGILHPSFPHQINKIWEVVESKPSAVTQLIWAMGLIPLPVGDYWSFILDVLFCGITLAATRYHHIANMPFFKLDKFIRRLVGPNPLRAHDAIGPGASFLTWSCLRHLSEKYGDLFSPTEELVRRKNSGESWYSSNRPVIDWSLDDEAEFQAWILGPLVQMTSLLLRENRAHLAIMNAIGELCAQFNKGVVAMVRNMGADKAAAIVNAYHKLHPAAATGCWFPEVFARMDGADWQQLYVNAEHNGQVGVITISREALNWDVIHELNRAVDWLKAEGIHRVILTGDFHLSTQMVGADITEFYPALNSEQSGFQVARLWSECARRFHTDFEVSVGFVGGKRCLGGMLELLAHCHYLISVESAQLGLPEVTLPVVPGMEGCHWLFRKSDAANWHKVTGLLFTGKAVRAPDGIGWLLDYAGPMDEAIKIVWDITTGAKGLPKRAIIGEPLSIPLDTYSLPSTGNPLIIACRKAIADCIRGSTAVPLSQALEVQAKHSAGFMTSAHCRSGAVGSNWKKVMEV